MAWIAYGPLRDWESPQRPDPRPREDDSQGTPQHDNALPCLYGVATCRGECNEGHQNRHHGVRPFGQLQMTIELPRKPSIMLQPPRLDPAADSSFLKNLHFDRRQLHESFFSVLLPRSSSHARHGVRMFSRELMEGSGLPMQAASDALCFTLLGTVFKSHWLVQWARRRHQHAVSLLEVDLRDQPPGKNAEIAGTLYLLGYCSGFKALPVSAKHRRLHHQKFLECASTLDVRSSQLAQTLLSLAQHMIVMYAPVDRKGFERGFGKSARRAVDSGSISTYSHKDRLALLCLDMSDLLERAESTYCSPNTTHDNVLTVISDMLVFEAKLKDWYTGWSTKTDGLVWRPASIESFQHFPALTSVFASVLQFRTYAECNVEISYWIALLSAHTATLDLLTLTPPSAFDMNRRLFLEANTCAEKLCQSLPWLTLEVHGFSRLFRSNAVLYSTSAWFKRTGQSEKLDWCWQAWTWIEEQGGIFSYCEL